MESDRFPSPQVFLFLANEKGASWAYSTPGFGASLAPSHLKMLRQMAMPDLDEAAKVTYLFQSHRSLGPFRFLLHKFILNLKGEQKVAGCGSSASCVPPPPKFMQD